MRLNPYLNFNGSCQTAFEFYERHLGGKIVAMRTFADSPMAEEVPSEWREKILHARLLLGKVALMGGDEMPEDYIVPQGFNVTINIDTPAEAERIFTALAQKGKIRMPLQETFWAVRFGMLDDQFGIPWMINCELASVEKSSA